MKTKEIKAKIKEASENARVVYNTYLKYTDKLSIREGKDKLNKAHEEEAYWTRRLREKLAAKQDKKASKGNYTLKFEGLFTIPKNGLWENIIKDVNRIRTEQETPNDGAIKIVIEKGSQDKCYKYELNTWVPITKIEYLNLHQERIDRETRFKKHQADLKKIFYNNPCDEKFNPGDKCNEEKGNGKKVVEALDNLAAEFQIEKMDKLIKQHEESINWQANRIIELTKQVEKLKSENKYTKEDLKNAFESGRFYHRIDSDDQKYYKYGDFAEYYDRVHNHEKPKE